MLIELYTNKNGIDQASQGAEFYGWIAEYKGIEDVKVLVPISWIVKVKEHRYLLRDSE